MGHGAGGCTFAVVRLEDGGYGIDDVEEARLVDELHGDFTPFVVTVDDAPHVIVAGVSRAEQVLVERADEVARLCHVKNGVWLSAPVPFTPGMRITATRRDKDGA